MSTRRSGDKDGLEDSVDELVGQLNEALKGKLSKAGLTLNDKQRDELALSMHFYEEIFETCLENALEGLNKEQITQLIEIAVEMLKEYRTLDPSQIEELSYIALKANGFRRIPSEKILTFDEVIKMPSAFASLSDTDRVEAERNLDAPQGRYEYDLFYYLKKSGASPDQLKKASDILEKYLIADKVPYRKSDKDEFSFSKIYQKLYYKYEVIADKMGQNVLAGKDLADGLKVPEVEIVTLDTQLKPIITDTPKRQKLVHQLTGLFTTDPYQNIWKYARMHARPYQDYLGDLIKDLPKEKVIELINVLDKALTNRYARDFVELATRGALEANEFVKRSSKEILTFEEARDYPSEFRDLDKVITRSRMERELKPIIDNRDSRSDIIEIIQKFREGSAEKSVRFYEDSGEFLRDAIRGLSKEAVIKVIGLIEKEEPRLAKEERFQQAIDYALKENNFVRSLSGEIIPSKAPKDKALAAGLTPDLQTPAKQPPVAGMSSAAKEKARAVGASLSGHMAASRASTSEATASQPATATARRPSQDQGRG